MRLSRQLRAKYSACVPGSLFKRALDDAHALAHESGFPLLFLPELAEEKVRLVSRFAGRCPPLSKRYCNEYEPAA
ncbi:MAG TPA: hypothetical protein VFV83_01890 [Chthoniobacteraceae bacterium]|nr:hypothetical protein [Chthoniobacteraceae bacterium]